MHSHDLDALSTSSTVNVTSSSMLAPLPEFAVPSPEWTAKYRSRISGASTLASGDVYVGVSPTPGCGLGLFAARDFAAGDVVTGYGGVLLHQQDARRLPKSAYTHIRSIPGHSFVRDGLPWSDSFPRSRALFAAEIERIAAARAAPSFPLNYAPTRLMPRCVDSSFSEDADGCVAADVTADMRRHVAASAVVMEASPLSHARIVNEGCGYMANTGVKQQLNVKVETVAVSRSGVVPARLFFVAARDIVAHEEILSPYNNDLQKAVQRAYNAQNAQTRRPA
jgi:hypothetical protein